MKGEGTGGRDGGKGRGEGTGEGMGRIIEVWLVRSQLYDAWIFR